MLVVHEVKRLSNLPNDLQKLKNQYCRIECSVDNGKATAVSFNEKGIAGIQNAVKEWVNKEWANLLISPKTRDLFLKHLDSMAEKLRKRIQPQEQTQTQQEKEKPRTM